jgi:hypothetical protein
MINICIAESKFEMFDHHEKLEGFKVTFGEQKMGL